MKYKIGISDHKFLTLNQEKQKHLIFLLLKEIEKADLLLDKILIEDLCRIIQLYNDKAMIDLCAQVVSSKSKQELINLFFPLFSEEFYTEKDFHFKSDIHIKNHDNETAKVSIPITIILHNLRSAFNVGAIIRSAECFGIENLIFSGYSPNPDHPKVKQTSMGTTEKISWHTCHDIFEEIQKYRRLGYRIHALETANPSFKLNEYAFPDKSVLIVGNEALGIEFELLEKVDAIIEIPLLGWKNSLNVGTATAICCYEISKQYLERKRV